MTLTLVSMLLINNLFLFTKHPMSMGLLLILQTIMMAMMSGLMMNMFWTSYILMMTMVSGMLVLFIYMSSIAPNEKFKNNIMLWSMNLIIISISSLFLFPQEKMIIKNNYLGLEMDLFPLNKIFQPESMSLIMMMVLYLFLVMIVSSYLVNIFEGPLRSKKNYE